MEIETTPIWPEALKIWHDTETPPRSHIRGVLHTSEENIEVFKVVTIDWIRDYTNNTADNGEVHFKFPFGDYVKRLYPFRDNLEFTFIEDEVFRVTDHDEGEAPQIEERYKAIFNRDKNLYIKLTDFDNIDKFSLDVTQMIDVKLELLYRPAEALRLKTTGGSYIQPSGLDKTREQITRSIMSSESVKVEVDGRPAAEVVDIEPFDNKEKIHQIIMPQHTSLSSVPTWIHQSANGVYDHGIGTYLQEYKGKRTWFVYPPYDYNKFKTSQKPKIIFYLVPARRVPFIDKTFRREGDVIHATVIAAKRYHDTAEGELMAKGSGFRKTEAKPMMNDPAQYEPDGPVADRGSLNDETSYKYRQDGVNYTPLTNTGVSDNTHVEKSRISPFAGARVDIVWDIADYRELYPAMPCRLIFLEEKSVRQLDGVILGAHVYRHMEGKSIGSRVMRTTCALSIFTEPFRGNSRKGNV